MLCSARQHVHRVTASLSSSFLSSSSSSSSSIFFNALSSSAPGCISGRCFRICSRSVIFSNSSNSSSCLSRRHTQTPVTITAVVVASPLRRLLSTTPQQSSNESPSSSSSSPSSASASSHSSSSPPSSSSSPRGPVSWKSVMLILLMGACGIAFYQYQREQIFNSTVLPNSQQSIGKPLLGGPFDLFDEEGKRVTSEDLRGKYVMLYFGFTNCPDVCPNELKKMEDALRYYKLKNRKMTIQPVFITIDPRRDDAARLKKIKLEYNSDWIWLTGPNEAIEKVAKSFRVYYSAPDVKPGEDDDYLVDHSIFFYLLDREGRFMDFFGKSLTAEDVALKIESNIRGDA